MELKGDSLFKIKLHCRNTENRTVTARLKIYKIGGNCVEEKEENYRLARKFFEKDFQVIEQSSSSSLNPSYPARSDNDPFYDSLEEEISDVNPHQTSKDETQTTTKRIIETTISSVNITTRVPTTVSTTTKNTTKSPVTTQSWVPISTLANQSIWPKPPGYKFVSTQTTKHTVDESDLSVSTSQKEDTTLSTRTIWPTPSGYVPILTEKTLAKTTIKTSSSKRTTTSSATTTSEPQTSTLWPRPNTPQNFATDFPPPEATRRTIEPQTSTLWPRPNKHQNFATDFPPPEATRKTIIFPAHEITRPTYDPIRRFQGPHIDESITAKVTATRKPTMTRQTEARTNQITQGWSEWTACECSIDGGRRSRKFTCLQADYSVLVSNF